MTLVQEMAELDDETLEDLGDDVTVNGTVVRMIFMTGYLEVAGGENVVEALQHVGWCRVSALPSPLPVGAPVVAPGGNYVFLAQDPPDETGFCRVTFGSP